MDKIEKYSDYCTAFYDKEKDTVCFYDEINDQIMEKQRVSGRAEADMVMRIWKDNAPEGIICDILSDQG